MRTLTSTIVFILCLIFLVAILFVQFSNPIRSTVTVVSTETKNIIHKKDSSTLIDYIISVVFENKRHLLSSFLRSPQNFSSVYIIDMPENFNKKCNPATYIYSIERLYFDWLINYHGVTKTCADATYFYVNAYIRDCYTNLDRADNEKGYNEWWSLIEQKIVNISLTCPGFSTDRAMIANLFPHDHPPIIEGMGMENLRYTHDLRNLRTDSVFTTNGRDIMVPFRLNYEEYESLPYFDERRLDLRPRQHFIFALCNEKWSDRSRQWRTKGYNILSNLNISDSVITKEIPEVDFRETLMTSDFFFVLPGDYPICFKMYKAILGGSIPVLFISSMEDLPFSNVMDWSTFSVVVEKDILNSNDAMENLVVFLQQIRTDLHLLAKMRTALHVASSYFDWRRMTFPSPYHMTLFELEYTTKSRSATDKNSLNDVTEKLGNEVIPDVLSKFLISRRL